MHSTDIMYTDSFDREHQYPELFTFHHNGDFFGDVILNIEDRRINTDFLGSNITRHGNKIVEVHIPFEVLARLVAQYVQNRRVEQLENSDNWKEMLGVK